MNMAPFDLNTSYSADNTRDRAAAHGGSSYWGDFNDIIRQDVAMMGGKLIDIIARYDRNGWEVNYVDCGNNYCRRMYSVDELMNRQREPRPVSHPCGWTGDITDFCRVIHPVAPEPTNSKAVKASITEKYDKATRMVFLRKRINDRVSQ